MRVLDLFSGIGGFRVALEMAGHEVIWSNEILSKPSSIYEYNHKTKPDQRDIRAIKPSSIPNADLLCGGFPCATFSIAGKRKGFSEEDTRGSLFFEICRILRAKRVPLVLLENVKGLLNHDSGRTFGIMLSTLDSMGYDCQWEVLNSKNFGIPQRRERIFIVGHLRGIPRPKVFPIGRSVRENFGQEEGKARIVMRSHTQANMKDDDRMSDYIWTLDTSPQGKMAVEYPAGTGLRSLTPLECERLQGLPDNYTKFYADGSLVEDRERYERCGRTIPIPVVKIIGDKLKYYENTTKI